jgi:hypothetical protein
LLLTWRAQSPTFSIDAHGILLHSAILILVLVHFHYDPPLSPTIQQIAKHTYLKMKFSAIAVVGLLMADSKAAAFAPLSSFQTGGARTSSKLHMALDMPDAPAVAQDNTLPVIQQNSYGQPTDVRYSDFLKLVNGNKIEKVTFSADGSQLLGVDVDGARLKIETLPNDPDLLTQLTSHKVRRRVFCRTASIIVLYIYCTQ